MNGWFYYNHAMVPDCSPEETPDLKPILDGSIWKLPEKPLLARWTTDFDCGYETNWWYCIRERSFKLDEVKAKRRYEINKGNKFFVVKRIIPADYAEQLYEVQIAAFSAYPKKYRPIVVKDDFINEVKKLELVYAAFEKESGDLSGYAKISFKGKELGFNVLKTKPEKEKFAVNAAIIYYILNDFSNWLDAPGNYICDGARNILHESAFQNYLEKYFGFRKAYCKLHLKYNPKYKVLVKIAYCFRRILSLFDNVGIIHKVNAVLKMEKIVRSEKKK